MKLLEHIKDCIALHKKHGNVEVVAGDCNKMFKVGGVEAIVVEDLNERYLEEIDPDDNVDEIPINAVVVYC
jgi:hypothetical protein